MISIYYYHCAIFFKLRMQSLLKAIVFFVSLFTVSSASAQSDNLGGWYIASLNYRFNAHFAAYGELQTRSQKLADDFFYHELKAGLAYYLQKNHFFLGFGNYETYTYPGNYKKPTVSNELRLWEQFVLNNNINRVKIEHRYRIEQRWINGDFFNRFRYRLNPIVPLNNKTIVPKTVYLTAFDEVFFTNKAPYFMRNRLFAGAGYQFASYFTFQLGFLRQFDYAADGTGTGKNFIQSSLLFTVDRSVDKHERLPSTMD